MSNSSLIVSLVLLGVLLSGASLVFADPSTEPGALQPNTLRCEFSNDPMGIDVAHPRLFWRVSSEQRGQRQTARRILVASSADTLAKNQGDLWDSGRVDSDQTTFVPYSGAPLVSSQQVFWKVQVWDRDGKPSSWSEPAQWTMGLLDAADWKSDWIGGATPSDGSMLLRHEFTVRPGLRRAIAYVSGLGQYEMSLNGAKAGDDLLTPGWTNYRDTILYDTLDVTSLAHEGRNAIGLILGNGMYHVERPQGRFAKFVGSFGDLKAIVHLRLEYADGTVEVVGTNPDWRTNPGPITFNSIYGGEDYDARLEPVGWNKPNFDDSAWPAAVKIESATMQPSAVLRGHSVGSEPVRAIETRKPVNVKTFPDSSIVYDFGQNASFMPRMRITGPRGSTVRLTPAEVIHPDGTINRGTMGGASRGSSWWQYTKATDGEESYFPKFYYIGSRYVRADLIPPGGDGSQTNVDPKLLPQIESIESVIIHSIATPLGQFSTSNEMLDQIHELVRWAQQSNMVSILTDCPHRERLGWLEQFHLNGPAIRYEFDLARLTTKAMNDMADSQTEDGLVPNIAPEYTKFKGTFRAAAEWGATFIIVPWQQYQFTGDVGLMRDHFDAMKRYFQYLESRATDDIVSEGLGDWYDLGGKKPGPAQLTPPPVTATAFYYEDAVLLSKIAAVLGKDDDAKDYASRAQRIRASFNRHFFDAQNGYYAADSQCANALPLVLGIVEPVDRSRVLDALVKDVEKHDNSMTAGDVGFRFLLQALAQGGRSDVIYRMVNQSDKPGYGYILKKGETSMTESWDANLSSSHDHFMLGQINEWFYKDLAGIDVDPAGPGFAKILIQPNPVGDLKWAQARYDSIHGPISVRWEKDGQQFKLNVSIPANTTATVSIPVHEGGSVREGENSAEKSPGVSLVRREGDRAVFTIESGSYAFESQ